MHIHRVLVFCCEDNIFWKSWTSWSGRRSPSASTAHCICKEICIIVISTIWLIWIIPSTGITAIVCGSVTSIATWWWTRRSYISQGVFLILNHLGNSQIWITSYERVAALCIICIFHNKLYRPFNLACIIIDVVYFSWNEESLNRTRIISSWWPGRCWSWWWVTWR